MEPARCNAVVLFIALMKRVAVLKSLTGRTCAKVTTAITGLLAVSCSAPAAPVVELFTSQGCYSCPPADEFLAELIEQHPDVVALEFHVDYWDDLKYGAAGIWKDPFSSSKYSTRQRSYNQQPLLGRPGVYTPQMIVNGVTAQVGISRTAVIAALAVQAPPATLKLTAESDQINIAVSGPVGTDAVVWLAEFDLFHETMVSAGENQGVKMQNHHVVTGLRRVGMAPATGDTISVSYRQQNNRSCAVLIQSPETGAMQAAAYCPNHSPAANEG